MPLTDDIRKTLTDPTPLYFAAGLIDKIREEAPSAFAAVRGTDPKEVQAKFTDRAKETQARMNKMLGDIDADIKKLREQTQSLAMQGLGYAAEYAVKAREAYGDLAERGRGAVQTWRGESDAPEITVEREPVRVAEPPKQQRSTSSSSTAKNGGSRTTAAGGSGGSKGTAKSTTARSTSAKSAAAKSTQPAKNGKPAAAKKTTEGAQGGKPSGGAATGGSASTPKSGS